MCKWKKLQVSLFSVQNTIVHVIEKLYGLFSFIFLPSKLTDSMKAGDMHPQYYQGSDWWLFSLTGSKDHLLCTKEPS